MRVSVCLAILAALSGDVVYGEEDGHPGSNQRLELLRVWWLVDELQIDVEQAAQVFPVWSEHNRTRQDLRRRRDEVESRVVRLLEQEGPQTAESDEDLSGHIRQLREIDAEAADIKRKFHDRMEDLLSLGQHARLLLFEDRFRRDLQGLVRGMRHTRSQREMGPWQEEEPAAGRRRKGVPDEERRGREGFRAPWW